MAGIITAAFEMVNKTSKRKRNQNNDQSRSVGDDFSEYFSSSASIEGDNSAKIFVFTPLLGVGPIKFGMPQSEINQLKNQIPGLSWVNYRNGRLEFFSINPRLGAKIHFQGKDLIEMNELDAVLFLAQHSTNFGQAQGGSLYFMDLGCAVLQFESPIIREFVFFARNANTHEPLCNSSMQSIREYYEDQIEYHEAIQYKRMHVADVESGFWFLVREGSELYVDINCSYSFVGYSFAMMLSESETSNYEKQGREYISNLAYDIQNSGPGLAATSSPYSDRILPAEVRLRVNNAILLWIESNRDRGIKVPAAPIQIKRQDSPSPPPQSEAGS